MSEKPFLHVSWWTRLLCTIRRHPLTRFYFISDDTVYVVANCPCLTISKEEK